MAGAVLLFLKQLEQVNRLVEAGMGVGGGLGAMLPLSQTATNMILSNVSPVMTDKFLCRELFSHGKIVSRGESHVWI